jgi:cobalt-zinc-cadmium resistance protein CzcA
LQRSAFDPGKTNLLLTQDPTSGGNIDNSIGITQTFGMPGLYKNQKNVHREQTSFLENAKAMTEAEIVKQVKLAYYGYLYGLERLKVLTFLDSLYADFARKADVRQRTGETSNLEKLTAQNKYREVLLREKEAVSDLKVYELTMQQLINSDSSLNIHEDLLPLPFMESSLDTAGSGSVPLIHYYEQGIRVAGARVKLERAKMWPELVVGYNHQLVIKGFDPAKLNRDYSPGTRIGGFQLGLAIPLFAGAYKARINAEKIGISVAQSQLASARLQWNTEWNKTWQEYLKWKQSVDYYQSTGLSLAAEQIRVARFAFGKGEIGYMEYIQNITLATDSRLNYLTAVNDYNKTVISLQYLKGNK